MAPLKVSVPFDTQNCEQKIMSEKEITANRELNHLPSDHLITKYFTIFTS